MKSGKLQIALLLTLLFGAGMIAKAQDKKTAVSNDQAWLQKFVGKWSANVTTTDDKKQSFTIIGHLDFKPVADGGGVYCTDSFDDAKLGKYRGSYLMGYDVYEKKLHFYAVTNKGVAHDHACTWKSADHFYAEFNGIRDGKSFKEMIDLVFKDKNTLEYSEVDFLDGNIVETDKGTFKKAQ